MDVPPHPHPKTGELLITCVLCCRYASVQNQRCKRTFQALSLCLLHFAAKGQAPSEAARKGDFPRLSKAPEPGQGFMERNRTAGGAGRLELRIPQKPGQAIGWEIAGFCGSPPSSACMLVMWGWQSLRTTGWKEPQDKPSGLL